MSHRFLTLLISGAIGFSATGCMSTSPVTRAQNTPVQSAGWGQPMIDSSCLNCQGHGLCPSCGNQNDTINLPFHPVHRNSYTYNTPQNLMYPDPSSPTGIIQYPYYTFRGPTDFFME